MKFDKDVFIFLILTLNKMQYLDNSEIGAVNAWEKFFEQPAGYNMEDVKKKKCDKLRRN